MDFHDKSQMYAVLTKTNKNLRLASNVQTGVEVSVSPETPEKLAVQPRQLAQKPRIDMGKTSKVAAAKPLAVKLRSSPLVLVVVAYALDWNCFMLNVAFSLVLVDVIELFVYTPKEKEKI